MSDSKIIMLGDHSVKPCPICDKMHARMVKCVRNDLVLKINRLTGAAGTIPYLLDANKKAKIMTEEMKKMAAEMSQAFDLMKTVCMENGDEGMKIWIQFEEKLGEIVCHPATASTGPGTSELSPGTENTILSETESRLSTEATTPGETTAPDSSL